MNVAQRIVDILLGENVHYDVNAHPELYRPTGKTLPDGRKVVKVCMNCEDEYGADKKYPPNVSVSHGVCPRHTLERFMSEPFNFPEEVARTKMNPNNNTPDWQEVLGPPPENIEQAPQGGAIVWNSHEQGATAPKATFWVTSGGG